MSEPTVGKRYLTVAETAVYLCMSRWSLYKLVDRRLVPFIPIATRADADGRASGKAMVRFDIKALDQWMEQRAITPRKRKLET